MKKVLLSILTILTLTIGIYAIWYNLPLNINRSNEIKLGNEIIKKIEAYKLKHGLPNEYDWETLRKFGFIDKVNFLQPEYRKLNDQSFELVYVEGFDGPYLIWNSSERKWKKAYPTFKKNE